MKCEFSRLETNYNWPRATVCIDPRTVRDEKVKWRDHTRVAKATAAFFDLPESQLTRGSVDPDAFRTTRVVIGRRGKIYQIYERHHGNFAAIIRELKLARRLMRWGPSSKDSKDHQVAVYHLGRALHYVHDSCTGKGFLGLFHDSLEESISSCNLPKDAFRLGLMDAQPHPARLRKVLRGISQSNDPKKVLWDAVYYGTLALKSVIEQGDIASAHQEAELMLSKFKKSRFTVGSLVVFLLVVAIATRNLVYFVPFLLGLVLFAVPYHYKARRDELAEWFGFARPPAHEVRGFLDKEGKREFKDHKDLKKFLSKYK